MVAKEHLARLLLTQYGLCIQFQQVNLKNAFLTKMRKHNIPMFTEEHGPHCYIKPEYQLDYADGTIGLKFDSEKHKFIFIEALNLPAEAYMDKGPGYESQLYFSNFSANKMDSIILNLDQYNEYFNSPLDSSPRP